MSNFIPLINVRSVYNFQESLIKVNEYISFAKKEGFEYLFYCENKTMYGVAEFFKKASKENIKPIIGLSIELDDKKIITLIPKNKKGYGHICLISSQLNDETKLNDDEIYILLKRSIDKNIILVTNVDDKNAFFNDAEVLNANEKNMFFNTIRYISDDDKEHYRGLFALKNGITINEANDLYKINESYPYSDEILEVFPETENVGRYICDSVELDIFDSNEKHMAKFIAPDNMPSFSYLKQKCLAGLNHYFRNIKNSDIPNEYIERLNTELNVIEKTGFADYFLIVHDYVAYARRNDIIVGPGRGSAAGSLVSFLLRITTVDPIEYNLLFERFLNPERITMPDIDIDFQDNRRDEVIEYLFEKYGKYNVATIVTYQTIAFKSAFRDACRVYQIDIELVNLITKSLTEDYLTFEEILKTQKLIKEYSEKKEFIPIFKLVEKLIGCPRQTGTHAAGIIISDVDLRTVLPIRQGLNGIYQTQFDMNYLEEIGLIKMDLLGLRNLTTIKEILDLIKTNHKKDFSLSKIDLNDAKTFKILREGNTTGIFQLESQGMTNLIIDMKVNNINDIAAASSLYRPGPQEMIPEYINNKNNRRVSLVDKSLAKILLPTYGVIVYQEQVMQILQLVGNFSLGKADIVRRAMGKKQIDYMMTVKDEFISNAIKNNYSEEKASAIWNWIEQFAKYGFNKSHAVAYSYIGYWLAWFKAHYPAEFYTALLNGVMGNLGKTSKYIKEVKQFGIEVIKPSVKPPSNKFEKTKINSVYASSDNRIYMPLTLIKGIGKDFIATLNNVADEHEDLFNDLNSFFFYMKNKGLNESNYTLLAKAGSFDCFGYTKSTMVANKDFIFSAMMAFNENLPLEKQTKIENLFEEQLNEEMESNYEKEVFGFYISANPITKLKNENAYFKPIDINKLVENMFDVNIIGQVSGIRIIKDKNQNNMAFITVFDDTETIDLTVFASNFENLQYDLVVNKNYVLKIKTQKYKNKITGILENIVKPV
ncbi:DNA polymerase III subunit alpha [Mesoplasma entomophilum]|uniref:DNA polymerase III subunit alpha n=1 Tax=Mesoplasma entomophilum TaxID=2149 RepID=UPI000D03F0A0|nr:DNA polymerase III subunit alpha [Mesoplasma entomophilum]AVN60580.1 DNA polymerase III subunit alpha [Mesoplasma entomophilum]